MVRLSLKKYSCKWCQVEPECRGGGGGGGLGASSGGGGGGSGGLSGGGGGGLSGGGGDGLSGDGEGGDAESPKYPSLMHPTAVSNSNVAVPRTILGRSVFRGS